MQNNGVHIHTQGLFNGGSTPGPLETALANLVNGLQPFFTQLLTAAEPILLSLLGGLVKAPATPTA